LSYVCVVVCVVWLLHHTNDQTVEQREVPQETKLQVETLVRGMVVSLTVFIYLSMKPDEVIPSGTCFVQPEEAPQRRGSDS